MEIKNHQLLGHGVVCIDAGYISPGLACFYLLRSGDDCAIIETGTSHSLANLEQSMSELGVAAQQIRYVIPTHVHLDHAGGAGRMMAAFPEAQLLVHPRGARHLIDPQRLIASSMGVYGAERFKQLYGEILPVGAKKVKEIADGEILCLGDRRLEFRHTRGHADHHFCIWDECARAWFSGDMFGISYPWFRFPDGDFLFPATTPTQFDPNYYLQSVELLVSYRPERFFLTHYGELIFQESHAVNLKSQLEAYKDIGLRHGTDIESIEHALTHYSLERLSELDKALPEGVLRERLAFDMNLNAQGLVAWQSRLSCR